MHPKNFRKKKSLKKDNLGLAAFSVIKIFGKYHSTNSLKTYFPHNNLLIQPYLYLNEETQNSH